MGSVRLVCHKWGAELQTINVVLLLSMFVYIFEIKKQMSVFVSVLQMRRRITDCHSSNRVKLFKFVRMFRIRYWIRVMMEICRNVRLNFEAVYIKTCT